MASEEIEKRKKELAEKREEREKKRAEQAEIDDLEIEELRLQYGAIKTVALPYHEGFVTRAAFRCPTRQEVKSFQGKYARAQDRKQGNAGIVELVEERAAACWIYPKTPEEREALLDKVSGILGTGAQAVRDLSEGVEEEEGKG